MNLDKHFLNRALFSPDDAGAAATAGAGGASAGAAAAASTAGAGAASTAATGASTAAADTAGATGGAQAATQAATLATGGQTAAAATTQAAATGDFPGDWRDKIAGEDKDFRKRLDRFTSLPDLAKSYRELEKRLSSGELKQALKPNATPEEAAEWRKANGIPVEAKEYVENLKLSDGVVIGEADKPLLNSLAEMAVKEGIPQATINKMVDWHYAEMAKAQGQAEQTIVARDQEFAAKAREQLVREWGGEFDANLRALKSFWNEADPSGELQQAILGARDASGNKVGDNPKAVNFLAKLAREINPAATILPAGSPTDVKSIDARIAEIDAKKYINGKQNPEYFGGPLFQEYQRLLDAKSKMGGRAA